ncbi:MAG TPA: hypothetical protein VJQ44_05985 [Gemmatimonadales bacterium]|nr:hypothetical protein [Gemmatimonadales bacterium]
MTHLAARLVPLADRRSVERELSRGGTTTVYLAHDLRHDQPVALEIRLDPLPGRGCFRVLLERMALP